MKNLFILFLLCSGLAIAQRNSATSKDTLVVDKGQKDSAKIFRPTINDYLVQTQYSQRKPYDTILVLDKYYRFTQYNNQDNFGKVPFANMGAGFQDLIFSINKNQNLALVPTNKSYFLIPEEEIRYYDVKTPTTSFVYHSAMKQGGALQSTYTQNIGKDFNIALEYMGLRSQGFYRRELSASNNFILSSRYNSPNQRYKIFAHYIHQNINNEENGGVQDLSLFLGDDSRFNNRQNLPVNLAAADSRFSTRRYYFSQEFQLTNSEKYPFKVRHTLQQQTNKYHYIQAAAEPFYQSAELIDAFGFNAYKFSKNLSNTVLLLFDNLSFRLEAGAKHQFITLGTPNMVPTSVGVFIPTTTTENRWGILGNLGINLWEKVDLKSFLEYSNGQVFGNFLRSENQFSFEPIKGYRLDGHVNFQTAKPSFNLLINPSFYKKFNYNFLGASNQNVLEVGGKINLKWLQSSIYANYYKVGNYTYIGANELPLQKNFSVYQAGGEATTGLGNFHLNTRIHFQAALENKEVFPMPSFVGRANFFYQSRAFKNAAEIQTGIKVYYFSKFNSREYFPVLNEFILADSNSAIGGRPIADAYFNLKVKSMIIFAEAQHFNTTFMKNRSFVAPNYPVSDFRINLGIVWHIFH